MIRRFDDVFFLDFPSVEERKEILRIMNAKYRTSIPEVMAERMENWTGAEIEKLAFSSIYDGPEEAFAAIRPIYNQCSQSIERAREWAKHNARLANETSYQEKSRKIKLKIGG